MNTDPECFLSSSIQLIEEDDVCSQPADSCQLNIHLPGLNDTDSLSSTTIDVQNVDLPQSTSELKEIDMNNATVECELLEHDSISLHNQIPDIDISVIATSTPKPLSKILQEVPQKYQLDVRKRLKEQHSFLISKLIHHIQIHLAL